MANPNAQPFQPPACDVVRQLNTDGAEAVKAVLRAMDRRRAAAG